MKRIEFFFSKILKEGVFDYLSSLTQADLERTKKYSDIEWSDALNEEAKRMPGFADTLIKKTEIESKAKGKVKVFILCNLKKIFALKDILKVQTNFQNEEE